MTPILHLNTDDDGNLNNVTQSKNQGKDSFHTFIYLCKISSLYLQSMLIFIFRENQELGSLHKKDC